MIRLLIIDDEREVGNFLSHLFRTKGYESTVLYSGNEFEHLDLTKDLFHLALVDLMLPDISGLEILTKLKRAQPQCKVIIMTGHSTIQTAVEAIKRGANDYIAKPFDELDVLEQQIDDFLISDISETEQKVYQIAQDAGLVVGENQEMKDLLKTAYKVSRKNVNVLIEGETGTGKEVLSRFIHEASPKNQEAFIGVNCGAISESLLESELFGHEKGSFTGATRERKGLFEVTNNGTLFLDEIVEASHAIQVKLLRVLETGEFMRIGSEKHIRTNVRVLAATNENLMEAVKKKKFREDLFYRLNVVTLTIPPLRNRKEDIPVLVEMFLQKHTENELTFSVDAMKRLQSYDWPGNVRELMNVLTRAVMLTDPEQKIIVAEDLPLPKDSLPSSFKVTNNERAGEVEPLCEIEEMLNTCIEEIISVVNKEDEIQLESVLNRVKGFEKELGKALIQETLRDTLGNRKEAAKRLNISIRKLRYLLNEKTYSPKESS
ncbi:sigma-54 dependent transcriptional regulator [Bacillus tianshenii]|nr:sigma-54 dependent transcriptional regulator [Bacillus tianshenii]